MGIFRKKVKLDEQEELFLELVQSKACSSIYLRNHGVKQPLMTYESLCRKGYSLSRWLDSEGNNNFDWRKK